MVAGQVVGMESFFEGNLGGLEEEGKGRREACTRFNPRPGGGGGRRRARGRLYTGAGFPLMADMCKDKKDTHTKASMQARDIIYMNEERKKLRSVRFIFNLTQTTPKSLFFLAFGGCLFQSVTLLSQQYSSNNLCNTVDKLGFHRLL